MVSWLEQIDSNGAIGRLLYNVSEPPFVTVFVPAARDWLRDG